MFEKITAQTRFFLPIFHARVTKLYRNLTRKTVAESPDMSSGTTPVKSQRGEVMNNSFPKGL